jgi:hypothetical protein
MMRSWEDKALTTIYLLLSVGSLVAAIAVLVRGDLGETGLDGIFLLLVCLLFAAVFGLIGVQDIRRPLLERWRQLRRVRAGGPNSGKAEAPAAGPQEMEQQQSKTAR